MVGYTEPSEKSTMETVWAGQELSEKYLACDYINHLSITVLIWTCFHLVIQMTQKLPKSHLKAAYNDELFRKSQHGAVETSVSSLAGQSLSSFAIKV